MSHAGGPSLAPSGTTSGDYPTALELVNRILVECRVSPTATTLNPGTTNTNIVFQALNDAQAALWQAERWEWRKRTYFIPLVADTADYTLPADFDELMMPPMLGGTTALNYQDPITFHTMWGLYDPQPTSGTPQCGTLLYQTIRLYPPPSATAITAAPRVQLLYLKKIPTRLTVAQELDSFDLPPEFLPALVAYGKYALKKALAYPDANDELGRYEELKAYQVRRASKSQGPPKIRRAGPVVMTDQGY